MKSIRWALVLLLLALPVTVGAQAPAAGGDAANPPAKDQEAAPIAPKLETRIPGEITPPGDVPLTPEQMQLITQKIDIGRINIEQLRQIIEGQPGVETLRMSLQDCIRIAVECSPDLQIVRFEPLKSDGDILASKGEFDPILSSTITYLRSTQEASPEYKRFGNISAFDVYRTNTKYSVSGKLHWGALYDVSMELDKEETTFTSFISQWSGGLTLTLSQPLLKGRGAKVNEARIRMAKNARRIAEGQLRIAVMTTASEVVKAYWDLVGAIESLRVREQALANADRLLEISQKRLDIGTGAAIEVLQAKAGVATRQTELITARTQVANAEDVLKQILNMRDDGIFSSKHVVPTDRPEVAEFKVENFKDVDQQLRASIDLALTNRPEMQTAQLEIETAKLDRTRTGNAMLPDVSVTGSIFQGERNHYMTGVFEGLLERKDNFYSVGVKGSVPLGNRVARGAFQRAEMTVRQAEQKLERTKQELMLKVRLAARALNTSQILVESNRQVSKLQETNVAAEEKRLLLGVSNSYRVLQVQQDLTAAQAQEVQARTAFEKALVELRLAEGTILGHLGIEFTPPEPEPPITFVRSIHPPEPE